MHADEVEIDADLVRRLLSSQFPRWAELPLAAVPSAGTDNALYRLGTEWVVRLPRIHWAAGQAEREQAWLPRLAPHLPLAVPEVVALGAPAEGYPWGWSVQRWLPGVNATLDQIADVNQLALDLASFVVALRQIDASLAPLSGASNSSRGVPLAERDAPTRSALAASHGLIDVAAATGAWEAALRVPSWSGPPVWIHGDLQSGNLLAQRGRLNAVIDFGCLGAGDPAVDLLPAWNLLPAAARDRFRRALAVDADTWARGRGWALSVSLVALPYYESRNPTLAGIARHTIAQVLTEPTRG
jgi:aminoglycoside phosphotransferase (APT) family kinase protein